MSLDTPINMYFVYIFQEQNTPLLVAVNNKSIEIVRILLEAGAHPDPQDHEGRSGLMVACNDDSVDIVKLLVLNKANTNIRDHKGKFLTTWSMEVPNPT